MEREVVNLYQRLIEGWNAADAEAMTSPLAESALVIGYDGSQMVGRQQARDELGAIFASHPTAKYVTKIRSVKTLGGDAALLHAVVGMVPPGGADVMAERNSIQTVVAHKDGGDWSVVLFQTTPAQFHGRPDATRALTEELSKELKHRPR